MKSDGISPSYLMKLINSIDKTIWERYSSYKDVEFFIKKWQKVEEDSWQNRWESFPIERKEEQKIDLFTTLHGIDGETLLKIAIDLSIETPNFIPSMPIFRNEIKSDYSTASATFEKAFKQIEEHPDIAIGLANAALESIIKEILKDERIATKLNPKKTLYDLTCDLLKEFQIFPNSDMPTEIKIIGSSLLSVSQSIEKLRSEKTHAHGKTEGEYIISEPIYTYFIVNSIATIGLFLISYYKNKLPKIDTKAMGVPDEDLPF